MPPDRPWWMAASPSYNRKRWDADVVFYVLCQGPSYVPSDLEREHLREYEITRRSR